MRHAVAFAANERLRVALVKLHAAHVAFLVHLLQALLEICILKFVEVCKLPMVDPWSTWSTPGPGRPLVNPWSTSGRPLVDQWSTLLRVCVKCGWGLQRGAKYFIMLFETKNDE